MIKVAPSGRLTLTGPGNQKALEQAVTECLNTSSPQAFQAEVDQTTLALCVCPFLPTLTFSSRIDEKIFDNQQLVTVFVGAQSTGSIDAGLLRDAFALSPREAEVCSLLLAGATPAQIAVQTGRSEKTVRNQVHALHDKIGVKSMREMSEALAVFRTVGAMLDP